MNKSILAYLKIEIKLFFREPLQIVFSFFFPAVMFAIFASVFSGNLSNSKDYFAVYIPGYFTTVIYIVATFMIGYRMVEDKASGIYKRLKVTPFSMKDIYKSMIIKSFILCTIGVIEILILSKYLYKVSLTSYWIQFIISFIIANIFAVAAGFVIFSLCSNGKQAMSLIIITFYPLMMLGDNAFPLKMMPIFLQKIAPIINPLYHLNQIMRASWKGNLFETKTSLIYITITILLFCYISYKYDRNIDNF
ncbi:ABC transporter permease [Oceanivirga miroungae]|uniref:Transport permease protein n=1 Tax=Oceanivirga miroungae TaxID=1130046 RepID=A0A6I8M6A5_9FUSO|nr:ABC transporter permease [Oceanivirga miroungae]VWL84964.1 hypothetical protein OMES3154_00236 [Oceanivirga miroungae]